MIRIGGEVELSCLEDPTISFNLMDSEVHQDTHTKEALLVSYSDFVGSNGVVCQDLLACDGRSEWAKTLLA